MLGYTGKWKGVEVSVMGSGMGIPSIGIYSYELFKFYGVENVVRIGSAGAFKPELNLVDVVIVDHAYSASSYAKEAFGYSNIQSITVNGDVHTILEDAFETETRREDRIGFHVFAKCNIHPDRSAIERKLAKPPVNITAMSARFEERLLAMVIYSKSLTFFTLHYPHGVCIVALNPRIVFRIYHDLATYRNYRRHDYCGNQKEFDGS
jgi:hypothetical protein